MLQAQTSRVLYISWH